MKHIKLFENWINESYYSASDIEKLKEFAAKVSAEITEEYADQFDRRSSGIEEEDYTPEEMFEYISDWGESNEMPASEVIAEFNWEELTQELGLENPLSR